MIAVMIVPTGVGAAIGGHSGDATSVACLLASAVDTLIVHPNVANASDLYAMPPNVLYVEGSMLDAMLESTLWLRPRRGNRVLVLCNNHNDLTTNAVHAARRIYGVAAVVGLLDHPLIMRGGRDGTSGIGKIRGLDQLIMQLSNHHPDYDAIAVHTPIDISGEVVEDYLRSGGINPWGYVEAMLSRRVSRALHVPCAHAPLELSPPKIPGPTHSRVAPEMICGSHLVSVLAGLSSAPGWVPRMERFKTEATDIGWEDVDVLVSPLCYGVPHKLCRRSEIPIMWVMENRTSQVERWEHDARVTDVHAATYLEVAGRLLAARLGRSVFSMGIEE